MVLVLLLSWLVPTVLHGLRRLRRWYAVPAHLRSTTARRRVKPAGGARGKHGGKDGRGRAHRLSSLWSTDWVKVLRVVSMVLFVAYPRCDAGAPVMPVCGPRRSPDPSHLCMWLLCM